MSSLNLLVENGVNKNLLKSFCVKSNLNSKQSLNFLYQGLPNTKHFFCEHNASHPAVPLIVATRSTLLNAVNNYLGSVQAANGVNEFRATIEEGADLVDRNTIKGKVFLKPTSVAEIIIFDFTLTPQGASFSD